MLFHSGDESLFDLKPGEIVGVEDAAFGVSAFAAEVELGCTKRVSSPFAIEKLFQLITARSVC